MTAQEGFIDRWMRILRQKLAAKERQVDDPAEAIDVLLQNQMEAIAQGRADLVAVGAAEKRLQAMVDEFRLRTQKYDAAAREALASGHTDAARTNVKRGLECERLIDEGRAHLSEVASQRAELAELVEQMRADYDRMRLRREAVNAMATGARATAAGTESLTAAGQIGTERERGLEAARETLARLRARSSALSELRASGSLDAVGAGEFGATPVAESDIDARLSALQP